MSTEKKFTEIEWIEHFKKAGFELYQTAGLKPQLEAYHAGTFNSEFRHLQDVTLQLGDQKYYGWIADIKSPEAGCFFYGIQVVTGWEGEPFDSEPITQYVGDIDQDHGIISVSDRKIA